jgi:hypothetical protein
MKQLKNLITLSHNIKIYVPSTNGTSAIDNSGYVHATLEFLAGLFDGATAYDGFGAWITKEGGQLVTEKIVICQSFCDQLALDCDIDKVYKYCLALKIELNQEAVALEVNNVLHFV